MSLSWGGGGTGKSTLLTYFRRNTRKNLVVLAPTGVAAVNVGGQTIHSFFGFKPDVTPGSVRKKGKDEKQNLYKKLTTIVIDEVSMVRADLLDEIVLALPPETERQTARKARERDPENAPEKFFAGRRLRKRPLQAPGNRAREKDVRARGGEERVDGEERNPRAPLIAERNHWLDEERVREERE